MLTSGSEHSLMTINSKIIMKIHVINVLKIEIFDFF